MRFFAARTATSWSRAILSVAASTSIGACSLFNTFADLNPEVEAGADATSTMDSGTPETGGGDSSATDSTVGDAMPTDSATEGGTDGGFPDKGVIVISGRVKNDAGALAGALTAIDPVTGMELPNAREALNIPVVVYDGLRDLWLIIETDGTSLFPAPTDRAVLHTRTLDPVTGTWTTIRSLQVPPPVFGLAAPVKNRLVYVGYDSDLDSQSGTSFITIDTTDPSMPSIYGAIPLPVQPDGIIATRSQTGSGGPVNMLLSVPCPTDGGAGGDDGGDSGGAGDAGDAGDDAEAGVIDAGGGGIGGGQCLAIQHVTVPTGTDPAQLTFTVQLGPFFGKAAYGSYLTAGPVDVIGWSRPGGNPGSPGPTAINSYSPQNEAPVGSPIPIQTSDGFFQPFAFAECQQQALLTATNEDLSVYAIPLGSASGTLARAATGHSGQSVYFEPYTSTVLAPFTQGDGFVLSAFTLGGTAASPTLTPRQTGWTPPPDVRPEVVAVRAPVPVKCPP